MNGAGLFFLLLFLLVILPAGAWIAYTRWRAHQQGLPAPPLRAYNPFSRNVGSSSSYPVAPRPSGVVGWFQDKLHALQNRGTGLENSSAHARGRGSFAQLDPDGAWDDRVGHEADMHGRIGDYEEQELGMHPGDQYGSSEPYRGRGDRQVLPAYGSEEPRGRSRMRDEDTAYVGGGQRGLDQRYDEEMGHADRPAGTPSANPFADDHEANSLRGVSPRPLPAELQAGMAGGLGHQKKGSGDTSSTKTGRQSLFHEDVTA